MTVRMMNTKRFLVVIVGPTGSGKTDLSIKLASHYGTEIISTDSRQIYKGMKIGTAQPSDEQLQQVKHHFIACVDINTHYNCATFEREALDKLGELFLKHEVVIAVGGAGLYVDALCDGMDDLPDADMELRARLQVQMQEKGLDALFRQLQELDAEYSRVVDRHNPARVLRAVEVCLQTSRPYSEFRKGETKRRDFDVIKIGVQRPRDVLYKRINERVDEMVRQGLVGEARAFYPFRNLKSLQTVGYKELFEAFDGNISEEEAVELIKRNSRRYAKRQMTWFGRDDRIHWFEPHDVDKIISHIDEQTKTHG